MFFRVHCICTINYCKHVYIYVYRCIVRTLYVCCKEKVSIVVYNYYASEGKRRRPMQRKRLRFVLNFFFLCRYTHTHNIYITHPHAHTHTLYFNTREKCINNVTAIEVITEQTGRSSGEL